MQAVPPTRSQHDGNRVDPLCADDFRRLGLGASEARVPVIRRAAGEAAAPWLSSRDSAGENARAQGEEELTRIVTSVYRLLDPRRRPTIIERIQLARVAPTPVRTSLWEGAGGTRRHTATAEPLGSNESQSESDWMLEMLADLRTEPAAGRPAAYAPVRRRFPDGRAALRGVWQTRSWRSFLIAATACGAAVLLAAFWWAPGRSGSTAGDSAKVAVAPRDASAVAPSPAPSSPEPVAPDRPSDPPDRDATDGQPAVPDRGLPGTDAGAASDPIDEAAIATDGAALDRGSDGRQMSSGTPDADTADESQEDFNSPAPMAMVDDDQPDTDPAATPAEPDLMSESVVEVESVTPPAAEPQPAGPPIPRPAPESRQLAEARRIVAEGLAERGASVTLGTPLAAELWKRATAADDQPAMQLALGWAAATQLLLNAKPAEAWEIAQRQARSYELPFAKAALVILGDAAERAVTTAEHRYVANWGLRVAEAALHEQQYALASEAARVATVSAVETGEDALRERCKRCRDTIAAAERLAPEVARRLAALDVSSATPRQAGLVGRQLCLNLRRWEEGLPWLAVAEIARLSKCAQDELMFGNQSSPDDRAENGRQWIDAADAQRGGRIADSMLLRGYELLKRAIADSSGVRRLELEKELRELEERLPADVLPLDRSAAQRWLEMAAGNSALRGGTAGGSRAAVDTSRDGENPPAAAADRNRGMVASVVVRREPAGVGLRFAPDRRLPRATIDQILDVVGLPHGPVSIDAHGYLQLPSPARIEITARGPVPVTAAPPDLGNIGNGMRLSINDREVPLEALSPVSDKTFVARFDLPAGMHRVRWELRGDQFPPCQLLIRDLSENRPLALRHDVVSRREVRRVPLDRWVTLSPR